MPGLTSLPTPGRVGALRQFTPPIAAWAFPLGLLVLLLVSSVTYAAPLFRISLENVPDHVQVKVVQRFARSLPKTRNPSPIDRALDNAVMTAKEARDPALVARLHAVAGRVLG